MRASSSGSQIPTTHFCHRLHVTIACVSEVIGRHPRSYDREAAGYYPMHNLDLHEQKTRTLDEVALLLGWPLPKCYLQLRRC
jgi:hypothetical protein